MKRRTYVSPHQLPCKWCGEPIPNDWHDKMCDGCWEAQRGLPSVPTKVILFELLDRLRRSLNRRIRNV